MPTLLLPPASFFKQNPTFFPSCPLFSIIFSLSLSLSDKLLKSTLSTMKSAPLPLLLLSIAALILSASGSIHDLLREHGLPEGLLPKAVESYTLDRTTGLLEVRLDRPCYAKYDGLAFFDRVVRGNLSYGALGSVSGLKQEELFLWLPVRGILLSNPASGVILFDIGVAHKQLSLSLFEVPPDCRPAEGAEVAAGRIREITKGLLGRKGGFQDQR